MGKSMTALLLIPATPNHEFNVAEVCGVIRSLWESAHEHVLAEGPFVVRVEVPERSLDVRVGRKLISMSPGSTTDDCAILAHNLVSKWSRTPLYFMDAGNNHALLIDGDTPIETLMRLADAPPIGR